jgi:regulator of RNase E activity RraA
MPNLWKDDAELFRLAREELFTAVVGDIMDTLGLRHQLLPPRIRPLQREMVVIGRAMTVLEADCFEDRPDPDRDGPVDQPLQKPFGLMFEALDDLKPGEVYVCAGASARYALWGELMSTRATHLGAAGAVVDGYSRDTWGILRMGFPTFSHGPFAQDQGVRGKVIDFRCPIEIGAGEVGSVTVRPGEIVFGDIDGVCVVPRDAEEQVFTGALEKARGEKLVKKAIEGGMSAVEAFDTFGIM